MSTEVELVRAGGGVVWRRSGPGAVEVLLVHRPRYDDWTFPKGKCDPGETEDDCALREVQEETGLRCSLGAELAMTQYIDRRGRPKTVRYWAMSVLDGTFTPGDEVDEVRWSPVEAAGPSLSYERDLDVLEAFRRSIR